jgi:hypothetical protein
LLKSIHPSKTSETIKNTPTMKISIVYGADHNVKRDNFYFTEKLMQHKSYDNNGNLITMGFCEIDKNLLLDIQNLAK